MNLIYGPPLSSFTGLGPPRPPRAQPFYLHPNNINVNFSFPDRKPDPPPYCTPKTAPKSKSRKNQTQINRPNFHIPQDPLPPTLPVPSEHFSWTLPFSPSILSAPPCFSRPRPLLHSPPLVALGRTCVPSPFPLSPFLHLSNSIRSISAKIPPRFLLLIFLFRLDVSASFFACCGVPEAPVLVQGPILFP